MSQYPSELYFWKGGEERTLGCACASEAFFAASSRTFRSSSSFNRSMSPLRMYLLGRGGTLSRALRLEAISALRASMIVWAVKRDYLSKKLRKLFAPFIPLQHHHNVRRRRCSEVRSKQKVAILNDSAQVMFLCSKYTLQTAGFDGTWLRHFCGQFGH